MAVAQIASAGTIVAASSLYETEPVELTSQPWFVNAVVVLQTSLAPRELLARVAAVESALGRQRTTPKGPRTIDLDILLLGNAVVDEPDLRIPHPAMQHRRFVLAPLAEVAPMLQVPVLGKTVLQLLRELHDNSVVRRLEERITL